MNLTSLTALCFTKLAIFFLGPSGIPISFRSSTVHISFKRKQTSTLVNLMIHEMKLKKGNYEKKLSSKVIEYPSQLNFSTPTLSNF